MHALIIVLDGAGCGEAPDAAAFGDEGANTLGHIFQAEPGLDLPALFSLGLWKLLTADVFDRRSRQTIGSFGRMRERSAGKDTTTGHWEIAGIILDQPLREITHRGGEFTIRAAELLEDEIGHTRISLVDANGIH